MIDNVFTNIYSDHTIVQSLCGTEVHDSAYSAAVQGSNPPESGGEESFATDKGSVGGQRSEMFHLRATSAPDCQPMEGQRSEMFHLRATSAPDHCAGDVSQ